MNLFEQIHNKALQCAKNFQKTEAALIQAIGEVDTHKVFWKLGFNSLFEYVCSLKLSESQACAFIAVSRKSKEVPELHNAITSGKLNVSKAKRICSVIEKDNSQDWIEKAATLSQREVEKEIVKIHPKKAVPDRSIPIASDVMDLGGSVSSGVEKKFRRVKDILSQKHKKSCNYEQAIEAMADCFLEKHDPVIKAKRNLLKSKPTKSSSSRNTRATSAKVKHTVMARTNGQCNYRDKTEKRCTQKRWLELHHEKPVSQGGKNTADNLNLLCFHHHKLQHELPITVTNHPTM